MLSDGSETYLYGLGRIGSDGSGGWGYHLGDALGSLRQLSDASGEITKTQSFEPFGAPLSSSGTATSDFGFTGEQDDIAGLVFLRARYYDPGVGRFITKDPFPGFSSLPATLHSYVYALNNPTNLVDPSGQNPILVALGIGGIIGGIAAGISHALSNPCQSLGDMLPSFSFWSDVVVGFVSGAVAAAIGSAVFFLGLSAGTTVAGLLGITSASGWSATAIGIVTLAISGIFAGQASRAATNVFFGQSISEGLFQPKDMLIDAALSLIFFKGLGGNYNEIAPSNLLKPGAYARESIAAKGPKASTGQKVKIQPLGDKWGCQHCGTRTPGGYHKVWIADHIDPTALAGGAPQRLYPQCDACRGIQANAVKGAVSEVVYHYAWRIYKAWAPIWMLWD